MAFPCCDQEPAANCAVRGGTPGPMGRHGSPGAPGPGGSGGSSCNWTTTTGTGENRRTVHHHRSGGHSGPSGRAGRKVTRPLRDGKRGESGQLTIHVDDSRQYSSRYDLQLCSVSMRSPQRLHESNYVFQFTDLVHIIDMACMNIGGMISPIQGSNVHFKEDVQFEHLVPNSDMGWFPTRLAPKEVGSIQGKLSFHVKPPNIRQLEYDIEPYRMKEKLYLGATQLGSYGFRRPYPNFHKGGITVDFRFPIENQTKLEGLPTVRAGEGTRVKFCVINTSLRDLGSKSQDGRRLAVQFYKNDQEMYDISSSYIDMFMDGVECNSKLDTNDGLWRGTCFEIPLLSAGQSKSFEGTLKLSSQVTPYSRLAVQAEILLEELKHDNNGLNEANLSAQKMLPVQRRQLQVSSEPTYVPSENNHVVLVTCATTTKQQFNAWLDLLTNRLGLKVEYYSVSIYGSLDPDFQPPNGGVTLAQAFKGKIVVVLDDTFNPLGPISVMEPSRMLPNGCQSQTSGYDANTRWLMVGSSDNAIKQALVSHFTAPPNDVTSFLSLKAFKKATKERLQKERKEGRVSDERIHEYSIRIRYVESRWNIRDRSIDKKAKVVKSFLEKMDPLRQYIVEPRGLIMKDNDGMSYQILAVRCGYSRTANSTNILKRATPPTQDDGNALLAVVKSLPLDTLHLVFVNAVSSEDKTLLGVTMDVFIQHLIWEVSNILEGRLNIRNTEDLREVFPTLVSIAGDAKLKQVAIDAGSNGSDALSKLLARLECIASSRDLNPTPLHLGLRRDVRKTLHKMVANLKKEWAEFISEDVIQQEVRVLEEEVLNHLKKTYGSPVHPFLRVRTASRWRKGLLHVCSYRNTDKYKQSDGFCGPTVRLCEMETLEYTKKSRAIAPSKTIASQEDCRIMRQQADDQKDLASQLLNSIKDMRNKMGLENEGEIEVQL